MKPVNFGNRSFAWLETKYGRLFSFEGQAHHEQYEILDYQGYIAWLLETGEYNLFIDVGSEIGLYSLVGAHYCKRVIAYEASPFYYGILLFNMRHKFNVDCRYAWVGKIGQIPKNRKEYIGTVTRKGTNVDFEYNIPIAELDDEILPLAILSKKTLIKMDIEGNELNALEKSTELLKLSNVHWVIDFHYDIIAEDIMNFFKNRIVYKGNPVIAIKGEPDEELDPIFDLKYWELVKV